MSDASTETLDPRPAGLLGRLQSFIEAEGTRRFIIAVIILNAIVIGLETSPAIMDAAGDALVLLDHLAVAVFVAEIIIKLIVYRFRFFTSAWNVFDFLIVAISLTPATEGLTVLRALRILRALRLVSAVPKMRVVIQALLEAVPGMSSVLALLCLVFYIAAVMATKLFAGDFPDWFGTIGRSAYTLFQIMTLESWSMGIVRPVMEVHPYAWVFFVPFILIVTFAVLNLFIAIIVNSMHDATAADAEKHQAEQDDLLRRMAEKIDLIEAKLAERPKPDGENDRPN
tara:strand:+ start:319 stop:1170 length:852 start_codon:yes stop_codon:yes gene_type:complete